MPSEAAIRYQRVLVQHHLTTAMAALESSIYDLRNNDDDQGQVMRLNTVKNDLDLVLSYLLNVLGPDTNLAVDAASNPDVHPDTIVHVIEEVQSNDPSPGQ